MSKLPRATNSDVFKRRRRANNSMPANAAMLANAALPANTAMPMFLTSCETEMHIWKYGCE